MRGEPTLASSRPARSKDSARREERKQSILDAAAELLPRWGYQKTTLADIAKQARLSKGTIYQYWKTREDLVNALLMREERLLMVEIKRRMEADPEGFTLIGMIKHSTLASLENPLIRTLTMREYEVLGEFTASTYEQSYRAQMLVYLHLIQLLRDLGLIRTDIDVQAQAYSIAAVSWGYLLINSLLPDEFKVPDEAKVDMMIHSLQRLLEPDTPPDAAQRQAGAEILQSFFDQAQTFIDQTELGEPSLI